MQDFLSKHICTCIKTLSTEKFTHRVSQSFFPTTPKHGDNLHTPLHIYLSHGNHLSLVASASPRGHLEVATVNLEICLHSHSS